MSTASTVIARWALSSPSEILQGVELLRAADSLDTDSIAALISHGEAIATAKQSVEQQTTPMKRRGRPRKQQEPAA